MTVSAEAQTRQPRIPRLLSPKSGSTALYILLVVVALYVTFGALTPGHRFFSLDNVFSIGLNSAELMLISVGMTYVLAAGHLDLSVGANLVLSSVVAAKLIVTLSGSTDQVANNIYPHQVLAIVVGVLAGIVSGALFGLFNGLLVTKLKINSFVVTLGTMGVATGIAYVLSSGANIPYLPIALQTDFGVRTIWRFPLPLIVAVALGLIAWLWLRRTTFGRYVLAIGSSRAGARRSGVRVERTTLLIFVLIGFLSGVAGVLDLTKFGTTAISSHDTDTMQAIAAVIIGGTSLFGGQASMGGTIVSTFIPTTLLSGFVMMGLEPFYQYIAIGGILVTAVYLDGLRRGRIGRGGD